eukprot:356295-Chlamydomonas_euryale.AAC.8
MCGMRAVVPSQKDKKKEGEETGCPDAGPQVPAPEDSSDDEDDGAPVDPAAVRLTSGMFDLGRG